MQIREGSCLSMLGMVTYDSDTGKIELSNLMAVLAGGVSEARRFLKTEISHNMTNLRTLSLISCLFLASAVAIGYVKYLRYNHEK